MPPAHGLSNKCVAECFSLEFSTLRNRVKDHLTWMTILTRMAFFSRCGPQICQLFYRFSLSSVFGKGIAPALIGRTPQHKRSEWDWKNLLVFHQKDTSPKMGCGNDTSLPKLVSIAGFACGKVWFLKGYFALKYRPKTPYALAFLETAKRGSVMAQFILRRCDKTKNRRASNN